MNIVFNAIAVLGGNLVKDQSGKWRTTNFEEGDIFGALGDRLRVVAAHKFYIGHQKTNPNLSIIVSGSNERVDPEGAAPPIAEILKKELIELGVAPDRILEDKKSTGTRQQLEGLEKLSAKLNLESVAVLSNQYHLPRILAIIEHDPLFVNLKKMLEAKKLILVSAEKVLLDHDCVNWEQIITRAYESDSMKQRIKLEEDGVRQIQSGAYKYI